MVTQQEWSEASNPGTPGPRLAQLAAQYPELGPYIAGNPACPPALRAQLSAAFGAQPTGTYYASTGAQPTPPRATGRIAAIVALVVVVIAVVGTVLAMVFWPRNSADEVVALPADSQSVDTPQSDATSTELTPTPGFTPVTPKDESAEPQPTTPNQQPEASTGTAQPPAVNGPIVYQPKVDTPSKNISCELDASGAYCSIKEREFSSGDCEGNQTWFSISVNDSGVANQCGQSYLGNVGDYFYELQYGETTVEGNFSCTAEETGMTCKNRTTGAGFTLSRAGYTTF